VAPPSPSSLFSFPLFLFFLYRIGTKETASLAGFKDLSYTISFSLFSPLFFFPESVANVGGGGIRRRGPLVSCSMLLCSPIFFPFVPFSSFLSKGSVAGTRQSRLQGLGELPSPFFFLLFPPLFFFACGEITTR